MNDSAPPSDPATFVPETEVPADPAAILSRPAPSGARRFTPLYFHARGGLGEIWVARDEELNRLVALKSIQERHLHTGGSRRRFKLEAEVTGRLEHPAIVPVYGLVEDEQGRPSYAMRLIRGLTLTQAVRQYHKDAQAPAPRRVVFRGLLQKFVIVCQAMAYAHAQGYVHRDLKPDNVMLGEFGEALVLDWGLARRVKSVSIDSTEVSTGPSPESSATETGPGGIVGTPAFMSPEQASGRAEALGSSSDIFSLGATLYFLLTGRPPAVAATNAQVLDLVRRCDFPSPRQANKDVPAALEAVCLKALARLPADRYSSALELAADVEAWLADEPIKAAGEPWPDRLARFGRRHRTWVRAGVAALLLVSVVSVVAFALVNQARQSEGRAFQIITLKRDLEQGRAVAEWSPTHLDHLDATLAALGQIDPAEAAEQKPKVRDALEQWVRLRLEAQTLTPDVHNRVLTVLAALESRDLTLAQDLSRRLAARLRQWDTLFSLAPPFSELGKVFDPKLVRGDGEGLVVQTGTEPPSPYMNLRL